MSRDLSIGMVISKCRNPKWGKVAFLTSLLSAILFFLSPSAFASNIAVISIAIILFFGGVIVPRVTGGIEITCIQNSPPNSVKNQHLKRYQINQGFGRIDVYIDIPSWANEFEIEMDITGPIEIVPWDNKPDSVLYKNQRFICKEDINGFPVTLKLVGEPEELAEGEYNLNFIDNRTQRVIHSVELIANPDPPANIDADDLDSEEEEEWDIEPVEVLE